MDGRFKNASGDDSYLDWYDKAVELAGQDKRTGLEILQELVQKCKTFLRGSRREL